MSDDKVKQLPGTSPIKSFTSMVKAMAEELPAQMEYHKMLAKVKKQYYQDCLSEGFTKEQAFTLCRDIFRGI